MRVAIVNDSPVAARCIRQVVDGADGYDVVWTASNGREAIRLFTENPVDLVLMDTGMPVMDGAETTRRIIEIAPCAVLVVTDTPDDDSAGIFEAMRWGALDVAATPQVDDSGSITGDAPLLKKIAAVSSLTGTEDANTPEGPHLIVIGSSTGGPGALGTILGDLPGDFRAPIVIVQHMDVGFVPGMAKWLNGQTELPVRLAASGDSIEPGVVYIAIGPDDLAMTAAGSLDYIAADERLPHHPCIDVFFRSVARQWPRPGTAAILSGMGRDGVSGLQLLRAAGWLTIAQDEATSAVYGMPKEAMAQGAACRSLPIQEIAPAIRGRVRATRSPGRKQ